MLLIIQKQLFCIACHSSNSVAHNYILLYVGDVEPVSVFMIVMFSITLFIWVLSMFFDFISYMMPTIRLKLGKVQIHTYHCLNYKIHT